MCLNFISFATASSEGDSDNGTGSRSVCHFDPACPNKANNCVLAASPLRIEGESGSVVVVGQWNAVKVVHRPLAVWIWYSVPVAKLK